MRLFLLFAILLLNIAAVAGIPSEAELRTLAEQASIKTFPDADSVLLFDREQIVRNADATGSSTDFMCYKILTEKGRRELSAIPIYFDAAFEKAAVSACSIQSPDGRVTVVAPEQNTRVMTESSQLGMNIYDPNSRILMLTVPNLQIGDILKLEVRRETLKSRIAGVYCDAFGLQSDVPILRYEISISVPDSLELRSVAVKDEVKDSITASVRRADGRIFYDWVARDVPALIPEPDMPPLSRCAQRLLVSSAPDWRSISRWYWNLSKPHLDKITPAIKAEVAALTADCKTPREKIMALFQFVSQKIRYMGITTETEAPGYEPHDVNITFENRYGVCRDKAALLTAMLREAGFEAFPVLFMAGARKDDEVPNNYFNHAITAVRLDGKYILMDPTFETTAEPLPGFESEMSYLVATPEGETLLLSDPVAPEKNPVDIATDAEIDRSGVLRGTTRIEFAGINDQMYRDAFARWNQETRKQFLGRLLQNALPGATLEKNTVEPSDLRDMNHPLRVELTYRADKQLDPDAGLQFLEPIRFSDSVGGTAWFLGGAGLPERKFPLLLSSTTLTREKSELRIPDGFKVSAPNGFEEVSPALRRSEKFHISDAPGNPAKVVAVRETALLKKDVSPSEYAALKNVLRKVDAESKSRLVVRNTRPDSAFLRDADAEILNLAVELDWSRRPDCVETTRVEKKILTYAGIKAQSELKIPYNPAFEKLEITDAEVVAPDGGITPLGKAEINIMDQPWVGAAPAYPPGKLLTVAFPSVKVGSILRYTLRREIEKDDFCSAVFAFAGNDPIRSVSFALKGDRKKLRIRATHAQELTVSDTPTEIRWSAQDLPALPKEPSTPPPMFFRPTVFVSDATAAEYAAKLHAALLAHTQNQPEAEKLAAVLTRDGKTDADKIRAIRDYVAVNIRAAGPGLNELPLRFLSDADATLQRRYGNNPDRAILLYTLLNSAGLKPEFSVASAVGKGIFERTSPFGAAGAAVELLPPSATFDAVQVKVGRKAVLNTNSQYAGLQTDPRCEFFALALPSGKIALNSTGVKNAVARIIELAWLKDNAARLTFTTVYSGVEAETARRQWEEMTPERQRRFIAEAAAAIDQNAVIETDMRCQVLQNGDAYQQTFAIRIPAFLRRDGDNVYFQLPLADGLAAQIPDPGVNRNNPLYVPVEQDSLLAYLFSPPSGYVLSSGGSNFFMKSNDRPIALRNLRRIDSSGRMLLDFQTFAPDGLTAPELTEAWNAVRRKVASPSENFIVFQKIKEIK